MTLDRARAAEAAQDWPQALHIYEELLAADATDVVARQGRAWALSRLERFGESEMEYSALASAFPGDAMWPYMAGYQAQQRGAHVHAVHLLDAALALRPGFVVALYRRGLSLAELSRPAQAIDSYRACHAAWRALPEGALRQKDRKNVAKALAGHARLLVATYGTPKALSEARGLLLQSIALEPADWSAHFNSGRSYKRCASTKARCRPTERASASNLGSGMSSERSGSACWP